jgi:hypothetical protein
MLFRLLIDLEALDFVNRVPLRPRRAIWDRIRLIQKYPANYSHYTAVEPDGKRLDVSILEGFHIFYWTDMADGHIKILRVEENE